MYAHNVLENNRSLKQTLNENNFVYIYIGIDSQFYYIRKYKLEENLRKQKLAY